MRSLRCTLVVAVVGLVACQGDDKATTPSGPGVLELVLSTPNSNDGAILLDVSGAVDSVQAAGYTTFVAVDSGDARVVITGDIAGGVIARLYVPDPSRVDQYTATLFEAAQRSSFALQNVVGYTLTLRPQP